MCTVICGGEDYNDMESFGLEREEWLRTFLDLPNEIPYSDALLSMNIMRKTALSLVEKEKYGRVSKKKIMFKAALNPTVLLEILFPA